MNSKYALLTKWEVKIRLYIAQVNSFSFLFMDQHKVKVNDIKIQKKNLGQYSAIHLTSVWVNKAFTVVYGKKRQFFSPTWEIPRRQDRSILPPQAANHFNMGFALSFYPQLQPYSDFLPRTPLGTLWYMYIVCCFTTHFFYLKYLNWPVEPYWFHCLWLWEMFWFIWQEIKNYGGSVNSMFCQ